MADSKLTFLYGKDGIHATEVKNTNRIRPEYLRFLTEFRKDYPDSQVAPLYRGKEKLLINNVLCIPSDVFLRALSP